MKIKKPEFKITIKITLKYLETHGILSSKILVLGKRVSKKMRDSLMYEVYHKE